MDEKAWLDLIKPDAIYCMRKYNYSSAVLGGQTSDETGYGITGLVKVNNVLGMKEKLLPYESTTWHGETVMTLTWEEENGVPVKRLASFRKYDSIRDCLEDFCQFMTYGKLSNGTVKYGKNVLGKSIDETLAYLTGRYATDSQYGAKIRNIIKKHNLEDWDKEVKKVHYISNCGHDEHGQYSGGAAGDQTGTEWEIKPWYSRPWDVVLEPPSKVAADTMAEMAIEAAHNEYIGYDQGDRTTFDTQLQQVTWPKAIRTPCEADCSSGVAAIVRSTGRVIGDAKMAAVSRDAYTGNLEAALTAAGFVTHRESKYLTGPDYIGNGWVLLCTGHHTAISVSTGSKFEGEKKMVVYRSVFLKNAYIVADTARVEHWKYDDSHSLPPCFGDGKISCDRLAEAAAWLSGAHHNKAGGHNTKELVGYLPTIGFTETKDRSKIKPGDVIIIGRRAKGPRAEDPTFHTFIVTAYNHATGMCDKIDMGEQWRVDSPQPFRNVPLNEWGEDERYVNLILQPAEDPEPEKKKTMRDCIKEGQEALNKYFGTGLKVDGDRGTLTETAFVKAFQNCLNRDYYKDGPMPVNGKLTNLTIAGLGTHYVEYKEPKQFLTTIVEIGVLLTGRDPDGVEYPGSYGNGLKAATGKNRMTAEDIRALFRPDLLK